MNAANTLLEAARAVAAETVETEVQRVAAEGLLRVLSAERAGWVAYGDSGPTIVLAVGAGHACDPPALLACADAARAAAHLVTHGHILCLPIPDARGVRGVLFAERARTVSPGALWEAQSAEALGTFVTASLKNVELFSSLESLVAQEMTRVVEREASMQLVLDSMAEGLVVCDALGTLGPIHSKAVTTWFGEPAPGAKLSVYLGDAKKGPFIDMGFEALVDGFMPPWVVTSAMPADIERAGRTYRLVFQAVEEADKVTLVVVTICDVTVQLEQERAERLNRELPVIVGMLMSDREGFQGFIEEMSALFRRLEASDSLSEQKRAVHTLKGNAYIYGFSSFGDACHRLEDRVAEAPSCLSSDSVRMLEAEWTQSLDRVSMFLTDEDAGGVRLGVSDYDVLLDRLTNRVDHEQLLHMVRSWREPKVASVLVPHANKARQVALALGKDIDVVVDGAGLRLPRSDLRSFCATLVHVVRNAVDHGLETPEERAVAGKPAKGSLHIGAWVDDDSFVVCVRDDGRGIDWPRLREKALASGLPAESEKDLVEALFTDGVSTRDEVTTLSGRGVGLGATRQRCIELGGRLSVQSEPGRGTRFEFRFPVETSRLAHSVRRLSRRPAAYVVPLAASSVR